MKDISILIPTYNNVCTTLVGDLQRQAEALAMTYEIIVADDGSTDVSSVETNRSINRLPQCRYVERRENTGRAAIRNFLASEARYEWLLFVDSDMVVRSGDFILRYAESPEAEVMVGGIQVGGDAQALRHNLRYRYEKAAEGEHTAARRQLSPYRDFHTANFLISRPLMTATPFDERFRRYGYEDVLLGKRLEQQGSRIVHIDNPLSFEHFETNADFVSKTEEGLRTLYQFRDELRGYSHLLDVVQGLSPAVRWAARLLFRLTSPTVRRLLTGECPNLSLFKAYKLGYFLAMTGKG